MWLLGDLGKFFCKLHLKADIWSYKCFLVWCPSVSLVNVLILDRQKPWWSGGPDENALLSSAAPGLHHKATSAAPRSHSGADMKQTELTKNIHLKIYCPGCLKNNQAWNMLKKWDTVSFPIWCWLLTVVAVWKKTEVVSNKRRHCGPGNDPVPGLQLA